MREDQKELKLNFVNKFPTSIMDEIKSKYKKYIEDCYKKEEFVKNNYQEHKKHKKPYKQHKQTKQKKSQYHKKH